MQRGIRLLLRCYPIEFREKWGDEYAEFLLAQRLEPRYRGVLGSIRFWVEAFGTALLRAFGRRPSASGAHGSQAPHASADSYSSNQPSGPAPFGSRGPRGSGGNGLMGLRQDVRFAVRGLGRAPWFTAIVVLTLGLALGANTVVFSVINGTLLAPLPYPDAPRLVAIWNDMPAMDWYERQVGRWVYDELELTVADGSPFEAITATKHERVNLVTDGVPVAAQSLRATAGFFDVFGAQPEMGRAFEPFEDRPGDDRVAVLSHGIWQRAFGGDPNILGRIIDANGIRRVVIGVMGPDFVPPRGNAELIFPLAIDRTDPPQPGGNDHYLYGKLRPGLAAPDVADQMTAFSVSLDEIYTQIDLERFGFHVYAVPLGDNLAKTARPALFLLMGTVLLILIVACANVTNLLLGRAERTRRERSLRLALGAGRLRIARLAAAESLVLAVGGGAAGLAFAILALGLVDRLASNFLPSTAQVGLAGFPLIFSTVVTILASVVIGTLPALRIMREQPADALRAGGRGAAGGGRVWVRWALVVSQVALSAVLLIGAALLGRSFMAVTAVDVGMDVSTLATFEMQLPIERYDTPETASAFVRGLEERLAASAGIISVGAADELPLAGTFIRTAFNIDGRDLAEFGGFLPDAFRQVVTQDFLSTLGVPLLQGRWWSDVDRFDASPTVMVNRTFAESLFSEGGALGERVGIFGTDEIEIIGVVEDSHFNRLDQPNGPMIYYHFDQWSDVVTDWVGFYSDPDGIPLSFVVRASGDATSLESFIRRELTAADPTIPITRLRTMETVIQSSMAERRLLLLSIAGFAMVGLVLGALGIYAVLSYALAERVREMGIRLALGATPAGLLRLTTLGGLRMTVLGLLIGVGGAVALSRALQGLLFGVEATDPASYAVVVTLVLAVATAACWFPARRAARTDPVEAFRSE